MSMYAHNLASSSVTIIDSPKGPTYEFYVPDLEDLRDLRVSITGHCLGALATRALSRGEVLDLTTKINCLTLAYPRISLTGRARTAFHKLLHADLETPLALLNTRTEVLVESAEKGIISAATLVEEITAMQDYPLTEFYAPRSGTDVIRWLDADGYICVIDVNDRDNIHLAIDINPEDDQIFVCRIPKRDGFFDDEQDEVVIYGTLDESGSFHPSYKQP